MLAILVFLNGGDLPLGMNNTSISLIPKVIKPQFILQYRPIPLCRVAYKISAKVLPNRLKVWMDDILGEEQSAFVPRRLITDKVLVAFKNVHAMKRRNKGNKLLCSKNWT